MPLVNPLFGHSGKPTFADARRDLEGTVVRSAAGVMRAGVFPDHLNPLVTGQSSMRVAIADFRAVQNRGGAVFLANVGADTSVTIAAAPSANRRIDLVYVTMRSSTLGDGVGNDTPIFGVVQGVASATPVAPPLPAALSTAIPLATVEIPAGATTTLSAGVIITQVYQYTAMAGGTVPVRNSIELNAWKPADGGRAFNIAENAEYVRTGGEWNRSAGKRWVHDFSMVLSGQAHKAEAVTFPAGMFTTTPVIQVNKTNGGLAMYIPYYVNATAAGCTVGLQSGNNTAASGTQMLQLVVTER